MGKEDKVILDVATKRLLKMAIEFLHIDAVIDERGAFRKDVEFLETWCRSVPVELSTLVLLQDIRATIGEDE